MLSGYFYSLLYTGGEVYNMSFFMEMELQMQSLISIITHLSFSLDPEDIDKFEQSCLEGVLLGSIMLATITVVSLGWAYYKSRKKNEKPKGRPQPQQVQPRYTYRYRVVWLLLLNNRQISYLKNKYDSIIYNRFFK